MHTVIPPNPPNPPTLWVTIGTLIIALSTIPALLVAGCEIAHRLIVIDPVIKTKKPLPLHYFFFNLSMVRLSRGRLRIHSLGNSLLPRHRFSCMACNNWEGRANQRFAVIVNAPVLQSPPKKLKQMVTSSLLVLLTEAYLFRQEDANQLPNFRTKHSPLDPARFNIIVWKVAPGTLG